MKILLKSGMDLNQVSEEGNNALMYSALHGYEECLRALIEAKVDLNRKNNDGWNALTIAASQGYEGCLEALTEAGEDLDLESIYEALIIALKGDNQKCIQMLIEALEQRDK